MEADDDGALLQPSHPRARCVEQMSALLKVYAPDALLHGTAEPQLNAGTEALRRYFRGLPGSGNKVTIQERRMMVLSDTAVMGVGSTRSGIRPASRSWSSNGATTG